MAIAWLTQTLTWSAVGLQIAQSSNNSCEANRSLKSCLLSTPSRGASLTATNSFGPMITQLYAAL